MPQHLRRHALVTSLPVTAASVPETSSTAAEQSDYVPLVPARLTAPTPAVGEVESSLFRASTTHRSVATSTKPLAYVMTPHTLDDHRTGDVGQIVFDRLSATPAFLASYDVVLFYDTADRDNSTTSAIQGGGDSASDCARDDRHIVAS
jgi:hypothetical protein